MVGCMGYPQVGVFFFQLPANCFIISYNLKLPVANMLILLSSRYHNRKLKKRYFERKGKTRERENEFLFTNFL